jgi:SAM-dependent methyltransferase
MPKASTGIDAFKVRALEELRKKNEPPRSYPVSAADLVRIPASPLCAEQNIEPVARVQLDSGLCFFETSACTSCLHVFRSISPGLAWFKRCWETISTKKLEVFNPTMEAFRKARYNDYWHLLQKRLPNAGARVLDIGTGYGTGTAVFKDAGCTVAAVEAEVDRVRYLENVFEIPVIANSAEEAVEQGGNHDLVLFSNCLEHLDDPVGVMSRISRLLSPGGFLYLEVPILWECVQWTDGLFLTHKHNFTEEGILGLVRKSGFKVLEAVQYADTGEDNVGYGLVLTRADQPGQALEDSDIPPVKVPAERSIREIRRLYRQNLPIEHVPAVSEVLQYTVPGIEHFFYTVRHDRRRLMSPDPGTGIMGFQSL